MNGAGFFGHNFVFGTLQAVTCRSVWPFFYKRHQVSICFCLLLMYGNRIAQCGRAPSADSCIVQYRCDITTLVSVYLFSKLIFITICLASVGEFPAMIKLFNVYTTPRPLFATGSHCVYNDFFIFSPLKPLLPWVSLSTATCELLYMRPHPRLLPLPPCPK